MKASCGIDADDRQFDGGRILEVVVVVVVAAAAAAAAVVAAAVIVYEIFN